MKSVRLPCAKTKLNKLINNKIGKSQKCISFSKIANVSKFTNYDFKMESFHHSRISTDVPPFFVVYLNSGMESDSQTDILESLPFISSCLNTHRRLLSRVNHLPSLRHTEISGMSLITSGSFIHCSRVPYIVRMPRLK